MDSSPKFPKRSDHPDGRVSQESSGDQSPNIVAENVSVTYGAGVPSPPLQMLLFRVSDSNRMHFRSQRVPFIGHTAELEKLWAFMDTEQPFLWWLITGEGGSGKSRLALELCLRHQETWKVGFLPDSSGYNRWSEWTPKGPTLIIVDYCSLRAKEIQSIVLALATREPPLEHRVRLLLVERSINGQWWTDFHGTGTTRLLVESVGHDEPITTSEMTDDQLWQAITVILEKSAIKLPDKEETLRALLKLDPLRRPLFATLAADALAAGRDIRVWDKTALLRDVLQREIEQFWKPDGVTERDQNLLCFATLQGGMFVRDLEIPVFSLADLPTIDSTDPSRFNAGRYQTMTGMSSTEFLSPLKPDVLGEFFVLERLKPRDTADQLRGFTAMAMAWMIRPLGMFDFVSRTLQDFPTHPSLKLLDFSLRKEVIEFVVGLVEATAREAQFMILAGAKSNLVRAYCDNQMIEEARSHCDELFQMSDQWIDMQVLESIGWVTVPTICLAFPSEARSLLDWLGQRWKTRGSHPEHLKLLMEHSFIMARGDKKNHDAAAPMCRELIWFAETFSSGVPPYALLAEQLRWLISAFVEDRRHATAKQIFDLLSDLGERASEDPSFVASWGAAGFNILRSYRAGEHDRVLDLLEVFQSTRIAFQSPHFKKGATAQFTAEFAEEAITVFGEYEKVFDDLLQNLRQSAVKGVVAKRIGVSRSSKGKRR